MQAHETPLEERHGREVPPAVVVGVSDDEAREEEEEVDGQVAVIDALVEVARGESLEQVEADDHEGRHAAQSVEDCVVGFRVGKGSVQRLCHGRCLVFGYGYFSGFSARSRATMRAATRSLAPGPPMTVRSSRKSANMRSRFSPPGRIARSSRSARVVSRFD